jgi:acyl-CoA reductase-like NAD-dependent aldehyde dehydrogenase
MGSYAYAAAASHVAETPVVELDAIVERVSGAKRSWCATDVAARVALLDAIADRLDAHAERWVEQETHAKGGTLDGNGSMEAWQNLYACHQNLAKLRTTLVHLRDHRAPPPPPGGFTTRGGGQVVARVFPTNVWDRLALPGFTAEVWMDPSKDLATVQREQAAYYQKVKPHMGGRTCLVLGAGNQSSIGFMDLLSVMFGEDQVVILKMNPVNDYLGPILRDIFAPMVERNWIEMVYGGPNVGAHLAKHSLIDTIHMTGSDATHDAIVWGPAEGRADRKARGEKLVTKPVTSELGNVTPVMVVPGEWSEKQLRYHAANLAINISHNAGFNCLALKVLVLSKEWSQADRLLELIRENLKQWGPRAAYYPGARDRWRQFVAAHPTAEVLGPQEDESVVPWTAIHDVDPDANDEICFQRESFCGVFSVVRLPGKDAASFLPGAVRFCNDRLWGTLVCGLLIHPRDRRDPAGNAAFEAALDELRYGSIAVNQFTQVGYGISVLPWGAYPGHTPENIGSGMGKVHNAYLFSNPQKGVVYGPFGFFTKMPWLPDHKRGHLVWKRLAALEHRPSVLKLPGITTALIGG